MFIYLNERKILYFNTFQTLLHTFDWSRRYLSSHYLSRPLLHTFPSVGPWLAASKTKARSSDRSVRLWTGFSELLRKIQTHFKTPLILKILVFISSNINKPLRIYLNKYMYSPVLNLISSMVYWIIFEIFKYVRTSSGCMALFCN